MTITPTGYQASGAAKAERSGNVFGPLIVFMLLWMTRRAAVPVEQHSPFVALRRTSPAIFRLERHHRRKPERDA
jgi:hypothetical protein